MTHSPRLHQFLKKNHYEQLSQDIATDIVVVGGGIAGVTAAWEILKSTDKQVCLVEAGKLAHGASSHNAGQLATYLERSHELLQWGYSLADIAAIQSHVLQAYQELQSIIEEAHIETHFRVFDGYLGIRSHELLQHHLDVVTQGSDSRLVKQAYVQHDIYTTLSPAQQNRVKGVSTEEIQQYLATQDQDYIAVLVIEKATMSSLMFCEGLIGYMLQRYPGRFQVYEKSPVASLHLMENEASLSVYNPQNDRAGGIRAQEVVMCTNGYNSINIQTYNGSNIRSWLNQHVHPGVGFMIAYASDGQEHDRAISYISRNPDLGNTYTGGQHDAYYYITERAYEIAGKQQRLVCLGGPEELLPPGKSPADGLLTPTDTYAMMQEFMQSCTLDIDTLAKPLFQWNGIMGYTDSRVRLIGEDPRFSNLYYNLGCNGVGLLGSVYGSWKIAQLLIGNTFGKSPYDPKV